MGVGDIISVVKDVPVLLKLKRGMGYRPKTEKDSIIRSLENVVSTYGDRPAISFEGQTLTWNELNAQANRLANTLKSEGIAKGDVVSIFMENRIELISCTLAALKLGAVAAFINTNLRGASLQHCITVTNSRLCIFGAELTEGIEGVRESLDFDSQSGYFGVPDSGVDLPDWCRNLVQASHNQDDSNPADSNETQLGDVAFYIFTSGTTGLPKAAVMSHRRLLQSATLSAVAGLRCTEKDRIYLCMPLYHGTALVIGAGAAITSGAEMFLRRKFSASNLLDEVREHKINCLIYVGELCRYLMNTPRKPDDHDNPLVRLMGNGLRPDIWSDFRERFGIERITEFYGASEGNVAFANLFNKEATIGLTSAKVALLKYDVSNNEVLRNEDGYCIEADPGEAGLLVGHINQSAEFEGYTDPNATEKKIMRNVFDDGDAWFDTGDLLKTVDVGFALRMPHYQFVDRTGDTFRWRSENVSTNEVAEIINGHNQILVCNVYSVPIPATEGRAGMAAVCLNEGVNSLDIDEFSKFVENQLPSYARPVFIRVQRDMDMTGTMKLVKKDLQAEGYDLVKVSDPIYVCKPRSNFYEPLDQAFAESIASGEAGY